MKKQVLIVVLALMTVSVQSQEKATVSKSKSVEFSEKDGSLLKREFYDLSKIKGVENQILIISNITTSQKIGCLRLTTSSYSKYGDDSYIGTLDLDEISACKKSLEHIQNELLPTTPEIYTECVYSTRDGLKFTAFYSIKESKWTIAVYVKGYTAKSASILDSNDLKSYISLLSEAEASIKAKLAAK